jgi:hypothetical protein
VQAPSEDLGGLGSAQRFAAGMSAAFAGQTAATGQFVATLRASGVDGAAISAAETALQASDMAAAAWARADRVLAGHGQVGEAYAANPGAGTRSFVTSEATGPPATGASASGDLAATVAAVTADTPRTRLKGGQSADTYLIVLPDGRKVVHKRGIDEIGGSDFVRQQADAEVLTAAVAGVVGARVAQVMRDPSDPSAVYVEYIEGLPSARQGGLGGWDELNKDPAAVRLGLLDALVGNGDRQAMMSPTGPVGIDHEQALWDLPAAAGPVAAYVDADTGFTPGPLAREQLEELGPALAALRPAFEAAGRGPWHDYVMYAHEQLCQRAVTAQLPVLAEPPLRGDAALAAPAMDLQAMTDAGDPRAAAIWFRTGDNSLTSGYQQAGFGALGDYLRDPDRSRRHPDRRLDQVAADIDDVMADSVLTRPILGYRGMSTYRLIDAEPGQWRGRAFHDPAPASLSTDPAVAATYGTVVTVLVPPGVGAVRLADRPEDEVPGQEILLQGRLTYRVTDERVQRDERGRLVRHDLVVEVVPPRPRRPAGNR